MSTPEKIGGVVLAGGESRRIGTNKAFLPLQGKPLVQWVCESLREALGDVRIIANDADVFRFLSVPVTADIYQGLGPLAGIHTALRTTDADGVFVLGCDTPFVTAELIRYVLSRRSQQPITVVHSNGRVHPLCGVYSRRLLPEIEARLIRRDLRLINLLNAVDTQVLPIDSSLQLFHPDLLANVNDRQELRAASSSRQRL